MRSLQSALDDDFVAAHGAKRSMRSMQYALQNFYYTNPASSAYNERQKDAVKLPK